VGIQHVANGVFEQRGDVDWFRMRLVAGQTYQIRGPDLALLGVILPSGDVMTFPFAYGNAINFVAPVSGDYFLSATSLGVTGFYSLTVTDVVDIIPATADTQRSLAVNGSVTITAAENPASSFLNDDWFAIDVVAGQSYLLATAAFSGRVYFANADGDVLAIEGFLGQGGRQAHFTATETGRIYAGISSSGGSGYTLTLTAVADDHGETPASAGSLTVGSTVNGLWETPGDDDAYAIALTAGSSYRFTVASPGVQSSIRIFDAAGTLVWTSQDQARPDLTTFSPDADGTYYVVAGTRESNSNPTGQANYTLTADLLASDLTDNVLTTGLLAVGGEVSSVFETPGDHDWVRIELVGGQSYLFTMEAQNWQDSGMALYDAQGELVRKAGTTYFGSQLHHTAETTGTYYVAAIAGQQPGNYTLFAEAVEDDYADNASTTGVAVANGLFSGVFEVTNDVDWFAVELVQGRTYSVDGAEVYDAAGTLLTMSNWGDASFTAAATGIYYLAVSGFEGEYEYGIVQIFDDNLESAATTGVVRQEIDGTGNADMFVSTERYEFFDGLGGDDLFVAGSGYDFFLGGSGIDTLSYANAGAGVEISMLLGRGQRGAGQPYDVFSGIENVVGSAFNDIVVGNGAANLLDGGGGADDLSGGGGGDTYLVDNGSDIVRELAGAGADLVYTSVSYVLPSNQEIETLSTRSHAGTDDLFLTGNQYNNTLIGNAGDNLLNGVDGADVMYGLAGDDTYVIDNVGDLVVDGFGQGNDLVLTYLSHTLTNGNEIETLSTVFHQGTTAINLGGSDYDNTLIGNYGANYLNGNGGADTMIGLNGDDTYVADNAGDQVVEAAGGGADVLFTFVGYALAAGQEVEAISTAVQGGTAAINLAGNEYGQIVVGNAGTNLIDGKGGSDSLYGLGGADTFAFTTALGAGNADTIADFVAGTDKIGLDDAIFTAIGGALGANAFVVGTAAADADDRIVYNQATGQLFYDADGNGGGAAVLFATLQGAPVLAASDFLLI